MDSKNDPQGHQRNGPEEVVMMANRPILAQRLYTGGRVKGEKVWVGVRAACERSHRNLNPRFDLFNHSPDGFEYGYGGSGPAQLALAILADHLKHFPQDLDYARKIGKTDDDLHETSDQLAVRCHQAFKFTVISGLKGDSWQLTSEEISNVLKRMAER
jgi:hypothetical protein